MKILIVIQFIGFVVFMDYTKSPIKSQQGCTRADILLISDWSGSINSSAGEAQICEALSGFIQGWELSEQGVKIGLVTFNDGASLNVPLTININQLQGYIKNLENYSAEGGTNMSDALYVMMQEFKGIFEGGHGRDRFDVRKIGIIISDGIPNDKVQAEKLALLAKGEDITIFTIQVGNPGDSGIPFLRRIATDEDFYVQTDYSSLKKFLMHLDPCM